MKTLPSNLPAIGGYPVNSIFSDLSGQEKYYEMIAFFGAKQLIDTNAATFKGNEKVDTAFIKAVTDKLFHKSVTANTTAEVLKFCNTELGASLTIENYQNDDTKFDILSVLYDAFRQVGVNEIVDLESDTWVGADELLRELPTNEQTGDIRPEKLVGLFYYVWHETHVENVYYISDALKNNEKAGPRGSYHYWGQPYLGHYRNSDEFVIRKHMEMISDAGVDFIFIDCTNAVPYTQTCINIFKVLDEMSNEGKKTPKVAFIVYAAQAQTARILYDTIYKDGSYKKHWFIYDGKPFMLADESQLDEDLRDFFTTRKSWAWTGEEWFGNGRHCWPWLDHTPQKYGWDKDETVPEQVTVTTAEHPTTNIGKSFSNGKEPENPTTVDGAYFKEQWENALKIDPKVIMITQFNEWVAIRFEATTDFMEEKYFHQGNRKIVPGDDVFVDVYNMEYNRDIEPMHGGYGDNFYYQMVDGIRRFKGTRKIKKADKMMRIRSFDDWEKVNNNYYARTLDIPHRNAKAAGSNLPDYVNNTARNDIYLVKACHDEDNVYFYAKAANTLTKREKDDKMYMLLLLNIGGSYNKGFYGYDYLVGRFVKDNQLSIEKYNDTSLEIVGYVDFEINGSQIHIKIPKKIILTSDEVKIDFKWADNIPEDFELMDFIDKGKVAPSGRFNYRFIG